jgi:hypothetical protein
MMTLLLGSMTILLDGLLWRNVLREPLVGLNLLSQLLLIITVIPFQLFTVLIALLIEFVPLVLVQQVVSLTTAMMITQIQLRAHSFWLEDLL